MLGAQARSNINPQPILSVQRLQNKVSHPECYKNRQVSKKLIGIVVARKLP
jgi:hypothetical protein